MSGILAGLLQRSSSFHVSQSPPGWIDTMAISETASGVNVNHDTALSCSAVWACVRVIAETVASLPLHVYRRQGRGRQRATDHPLYTLLHTLPNPEMSAFEFREALTGHLCTWGNAYAEIEWSRAGSVMGLWPLRPDRMTVKREDGQIYYYYQVDNVGPDKRLPAWRIWHLRGFGSNGITAYSPILMHKQAIGLSLATEEYGARFFGNGAEPGGVLQHPGKLTDQAHTRMRKSWEDAHKGLERSHRVAILEEGVQYQKVGLEPEAAQFLQTRKFQISDVARIYRVPPHMVGDLEKATFSNIEHQGLEFVMYTMMPWLVRWEQGVYRSLLVGQEREDLFAEYLVDALLRGDTASRYEAYAVARQNGWMNADEIRERENMNPLPDGQGQVYLVPLNMVPADSVRGVEPVPGMESSPEDAGPEPGDPGEDARLEPGDPMSEERSVRSAAHRHRLQQSHHRVYRDVAARVLRREKNDVGAAARKFLGQRSLNEFILWLEDFYQQHRGFVLEQFEPIARAYGEMVAGAAQDEIGEQQAMTPEIERFVRDYLTAFAARHSQISAARLRELLNEPDPLAAIEAELDGWPERRADETARWEAVRFNNALAWMVYLGAGVLKMRWRAFNKSCPYCRALDGRVVGIQEFFLHSGEDYQPDGADHALKTNHNVRHAPAHAGCDCMVTAGG